MRIRSNLVEDSYGLDYANVCDRPNDMGILLTEISAEKGCSLYAYGSQKNVFTSTAPLGDNAKSVDSEESEPGGVNGTDAGSFPGSLLVTSPTEPEVLGPAKGGRANMSALMKQLDDDRKASELDVQELQEKLDHLQGGVDKLSGVIEEMMLISSKKAA